MPPEFTPQQIADWKLERDISTLIAVANHCEPPKPEPIPVKAYVAPKPVKRTKTTARKPKKSTRKGKISTSRYYSQTIGKQQQTSDSKRKATGDQKKVVDGTG